MKFTPRTIRDFGHIDRMVLLGQNDEQIFKAISNENWRSEVTTCDGRPHCTICSQPITLEACSGCGQSIEVTDGQ